MKGRPFLYLGCNKLLFIFLVSIYLIFNHFDLYLVITNCNFSRVTVRLISPPYNHSRYLLLFIKTYTYRGISIIYTLSLCSFIHKMSCQSFIFHWSLYKCNVTRLLWVRSYNDIHYILAILWESYLVDNFYLKMIFFYFKLWP